MYEDGGWRMEKVEEEEEDGWMYQYGWGREWADEGWDVCMDLWTGPEWMFVYLFVCLFV